MFNDLHIETSRSPDVNVFSRFQANWGLLPRNSDQPLAPLDIAEFSEASQVLLNKWKADTESILSSKMDLTRDDYREFLELCMFFLGCQQSITFKQPGAFHKARWMSKLLYSIKIALMQDQIQQLPQGTVTTKKQLPKIRDFVVFATIVYSMWWFTCHVAVDAPWNDLSLHKRLLEYADVNAGISASAIKALKRHFWYLTEEMIPLSLFSEIVPAQERQALARRLLELKPDQAVITPCNRYGTGFGKPRFPENVTQTTTLADLAGVDFWFCYEHFTD